MSGRRDRRLREPRADQRKMPHTGTLTVSRKPPALQSPKVISPPCERAKTAAHMMSSSVKADLPIRSSSGKKNLSYNALR
jgi:hypothetical protein